jgi:hypothetical protein
MAAAWFARVCAYVVWLPACTVLRGMPLLESPQTISTSSHESPSTSAAGRAVSAIECVPRLPMP